MSRFRQFVLVALFAAPIILMTAFALVIIWPLMTLFDWLDEGHVDPGRTFKEAFGIWDEFTSTVRMVK